MKLGLVGKNGSGKSAVCGYLNSLGFKVYSLSDIVRQEATNKGLSQDRDQLVALANDLKSKGGPAVLAERILAYSNSNNDQKVVFDSIRNKDEIEYLTAHGVQIIGVDADVEIRYKRIEQRKSSTDQIDFETFKAHDVRENTGVSSGQNINQALSLCEHLFENNGSFDSLTKKIEAFLMMKSQEANA